MGLLRMEPINYMLDVANPMQMALGGYQSALGQAQTRQQMGLANTQEARAAETFALEKRAMEEQRAAAAAERQAAIEARQRGDAAMMRLIDLGPNATSKDYLIAINENPAYKESLSMVFDTFSEERKAGEIQSGLQLWAAVKSNPEVAASLIAERKRAAEAAGDQETFDTMRAFELQLAGPGGSDLLTATLGSSLAGLMGADDFKKAAEAIGVGSGEDKKEMFELEKQIRKEYTDLTKDFRLVAQAYDRVEASQDTGPGDIALIFNYMKMLDPGSTIREGEFATAQQSGGIPTAIRNSYNQAVAGERLTPEQRASFKSQAADLFVAASKAEERARASLMPVINEYGLDENQIFGVSGETQVEARAGAPAPAPADNDAKAAFMANPNIAALTPEVRERAWEIYQKQTGQ